MQIGVISDTHGLLRPEALAALTGSDLILHAGDVGRAEILDELSRLARVIAVRGNVDRAAWAARLPETEIVTAGDLYLYLLHDRQGLDLDPAAGGFSAVISGHSHKPVITWHGDLLYLNPGSAGPRRFYLPVTVARLTVDGRALTAEIIDLAR